jgi:hypothetical protein
MAGQKIAAFLNDRHTETLVLIREIADTDTELALDVYTRNPRHAKLALEDLKVAIDDLLDQWDKYEKLPPATTEPEAHIHTHNGGRWPLRIIRTSTKH